MLRRVSYLFVLTALAFTMQADVLRILDDPREAAQARVDIIQQAGHEIAAVYFIARKDDVTLTALTLLRDAARRGVRIRLVVDAAFQHIPQPLLLHLNDEGVQIRVYHPLTLRHPTWTYKRMHEKFVVADAERYIAGGRNLAGAYFGMARKNYVDRDVYVEGASAADAMRHFEELWSSRDVADLKGRVTIKARRNAAQTLDAHLEKLRRGDGFVELATERDWSGGLAESDSVRFLHDPITPGGGVRVGAQVEELIRSATTSIVIESPYVVPSPSLRQLLEGKARDGVRVKIVTNSRHSTDGTLPYVAYLKYRRRLIAAGVEIHEYNGPDVLHAKSIVIDARIAMVGSYNLDPRSRNLNAEMMCLAEDEELASQLLASIDAHVEASTPVTVHTGRGRTFRAFTMRLILPFVEGQL